MQISIASVRIPNGEEPTVGVMLEPYILFRDEEPNVVRALSIQEENAPTPFGEPESPIMLRSRWYRQSVDQAVVCGIHPDKDATLQCLLCLKSRVPSHLSYHCTGECLQAHWPMHRANHIRYLQQAHAHYIQNGYENGFGHPYQSSSFSRNLDVPGYDASQPPMCNWVEVGCNRCYTPSLDDVGNALRYECSLVFSGTKTTPYANGNLANGHIGSTDTATNSEINRCLKMSAETWRVKPSPNPPIRAMIPLTCADPRMVQDGRFTVLSYNILADLHATQGDYHHAHCPAWAISWEYRKENLVKELLRYSCDILCLQEVQSNHYESLRESLAAAGYEGVYKRKTIDLYAGKCTAIDGCATFFRKDRFDLIKKYEVEFNKAAVTTANHFREPMRNVALQRLSRDNVAIIVVLESKEVLSSGEKPLVCVANTHIHSVPENSDIKIWQVHTLLKGLEKIASSTKIPIIVAGDFSSEPGSAAHTLMVNRIIDQRHPETANDPAQFLQPLLPVQHTLPLRSAYSAIIAAPNSKENPGLTQQKTRIDPRTREPFFTNYTKTYKGTLDYIFYTPTLLTPTALLELPAEDEADIDNGIPNARYSSDHVCIMAEFQLAYNTFEHWL